MPFYGGSLAVGAGRRRSSAHRPSPASSGLGAGPGSGIPGSFEPDQEGSAVWSASRSPGEGSAHWGTPGGGGGRRRRSSASPAVGFIFPELDVPSARGDDSSGQTGGADEHDQLVAMLGEGMLPAATAGASSARRRSSGFFGPRTPRESVSLTPSGAALLESSPNQPLPPSPAATTTGRAPGQPAPAGDVDDEEEGGQRYEMDAETFMARRQARKESIFSARLARSGSASVGPSARLPPKRSTGTGSPPRSSLAPGRASYRFALDGEDGITAAESMEFGPPLDINLGDEQEGEEEEEELEEGWAPLAFFSKGSDPIHRGAPTADSAGRGASSCMALTGSGKAAGSGSGSGSGSKSVLTYGTSSLPSTNTNASTFGNFARSSSWTALGKRMSGSMGSFLGTTGKRFRRRSSGEGAKERTPPEHPVAEAQVGEESETSALRRRTSASARDATEIMERNASFVSKASVVRQEKAARERAHSEAVQTVTKLRESVTHAAGAKRGTMSRKLTGLDAVHDGDAEALVFDESQLALLEAAHRRVPVSFVVTELAARVEAFQVKDDVFLYIPFVIMFTLFFLGARDIEVNHYFAAAEKNHIVTSTGEYTHFQSLQLQSYFRGPSVLKAPQSNSSSGTMSSDGNNTAAGSGVSTVGWWDWGPGPNSTGTVGPDAKSTTKNQEEEPVQQRWPWDYGWGIRGTHHSDHPEEESLWMQQERQFEEITNGPQWVKWLQEVFVPNTWDCVNPHFAENIATKRLGQTVLLGGARLRVIRVRPDTCEFNPTLRHFGGQSAAGAGAGGTSDANQQPQQTDSTLLTNPPPPSPSALDTGNSSDNDPSLGNANSSLGSSSSGGVDTIGSVGSSSGSSSSSLQQQEEQARREAEAVDARRHRCYADYEEKAIDTEPFCHQPNPTMQNETLFAYRECPSLEISYRGENLLYPCSGHSVTIPFNTTCTSVLDLLSLVTPIADQPDTTGASRYSPDELLYPTVAKRAINETHCNSFVLHQSTRMVMLEYFAYNLEANTFLRVKALCEVTAGGAWVPNYNTRVFAVWSPTRYLAWTIFDFIFFATVIYFGRKFVMDWSNFRRSTGKWLPFLFDLWNLIELTNLVTFVVSVSLKLVWWLRSSDFRVTFNTEPFYPEALDKIEYYYSTQMFANSVNIVLTYLKILKYLRLNDRLNVLSRTLAACQSNILVTLVLFVFLDIGYALAGTQLYGMNVREYKNFNTSLSTLFFALLGEFDYVGWRAKQPELTAPFFWSFVFIGYFIFLNFIIAMLGEGFAQTVRATYLQPLSDVILRQMEELRFVFTKRYFQEYIRSKFQAKDRGDLLHTTYDYVREHLELTYDSTIDLGLRPDPTMEYADLFWWLPSSLIEELGARYLAVLWEDIVYEYYNKAKSSAVFLEKETARQLVAQGMGVYLENALPNIQALEMQAELLVDKLERLPARIVSSAHPLLNSANLPGTGAASGSGMTSSSRKGILREKDSAHHQKPRAERVEQPRRVGLALEQHRSKAAGAAPVATRGGGGGGTALSIGFDDEPTGPREDDDTTREMDETQQEGTATADPASGGRRRRAPMVSFFEET